MAEFVLFDGVNDYVTTPDNAALDITGDIDLRACARLTDWSSTEQAVVAKWWITDNSYYLRVLATGVLRLAWRNAAGSYFSADSTVAVSFANGADGWIRATLDVNNGSSQREIKFYTSAESPDTDPSAVTWAQLGATVTQGGTTDIRATTVEATLGAIDGGSSPLAGRIYYAEVRNGIGGTVVANPDFRTTAQADSDTQFTDDSSRVWTLTGGADWSGTLGAGLDYVLFDGSNDYISSPDHASLDITGDLDLRGCVRLVDWSDGTGQTIVAKWWVTDTSYMFIVEGDGTLELGWTDAASGSSFETSTVAVPFANGADGWVRATLDVNNGSSQHEVKFYTSSDPPTTAPASVAWTQLGTTIVVGGTTDIKATTVQASLGMIDNSSATLTGRLYYAEIRNGIGGTIVASPDFRDLSAGTGGPPPTSYTDAQSRVWTLQNGATWTESGAADADLTVTWRPLDFEFYPHRDSASVDFIIEFPTLDFVVDGVRWTVNAASTTVDVTWRPFDFTFDGDRWTVDTEQEAEPPPPPPALPVLTTEDLLSATSLSIAVGLELLDVNDVVLADISADLETGVVARNMNAAIHGTARFRLARTIEWHNQRLRPYMTIADLISGVSERFDLGIYLPETPSRTTGRTPMSFDVEAYDKLVILDHPHGVAFTVTAGDDVLETVESLLDDLDLPHAFDQSSSAVVPSTRSWPLSAQNTTLLIVNELLASVGYRGLYVDRQGVFRSEPYRPPADRAPVWHYDATSTRAIIGAEISEEIDLFAVPNWWVFVRDDPAQAAPSEGDGIYTVLNSTDGPTSISARGRVIRKVEYVDAADQASLVALGDQIVQRDRQPYAHLEFIAVPNPLHWHADSVTVTSSELGLVGATFGEQSWSLPLDGGDMSHKVRRSVTV